MLSQYDVDPTPMRQPLAPLSVCKNTGIQKPSSAKKDQGRASTLATPGKGASSVVPATSAYSKWSQRLSSVSGATPVRAASTYGSSGSASLTWSSIKAAGSVARLPKKGDQILCVSRCCHVLRLPNHSTDRLMALPSTTLCPTLQPSCCSTRRTTSLSSLCRRAPSTASTSAIQKPPRASTHATSSKFRARLRC